MGFAIVADTTCDLTPEEAKAHGIEMIPLNILLDGKEYRDGVDLTADEFFDLMETSDNLPKTAQPSPYDFAQLYQRLADEGAEAIVSLHICAPMSGTVEAAAMGAQQVDIPVEVIDSCGVTGYLGLLTLYTARLRDRGLTFAETVEKVKQAIPHIYFRDSPRTLDNLLKGGRLSPLNAKAASLLNIKPLLAFKEDGTLYSFGKVRGMKGVIKTFAKDIEELTAKRGKQYLRFCHTRNLEDLQKLKDQLAADGVEYVDMGTAPSGATVATHLGIGSIGFAALKADE